MTHADSNQEMPREAHLGEELPRAGGGCCGQGQCGCGGHEKAEQDGHGSGHGSAAGCQCDGSGACGCTDGRCSCGAAECRCCRQPEATTPTGSCCGGRH